MKEPLEEPSKEPLKFARQELLGTEPRSAASAISMSGVVSVAESRLVLEFAWWESQTPETRGCGVAPWRQNPTEQLLKSESVFSLC